jgi:hypothetical protein
MTNSIQAIDVHNRLLTPMDAEIEITVTLAHVHPTSEIRGRLVGPRCALATTVEVAYPLRPLPRHADAVPRLAARVHIPEPSLWEQQCPFYYDGRVELWENGARVETKEFRHELRRGN